jgi:hypothetical protein
MFRKRQSLYRFVTVRWILSDMVLARAASSCLEMITEIVRHCASGEDPAANFLHRNQSITDSPEWWRTNLRRDLLGTPTGGGAPLPDVRRT